MAAPKAPKLEGTTPCKACGVPLIFALNEATGKTIPLDVRHHPIYVLVIHEGVAKAKQTPGYVSHFVTCPKASEFSRKPQGAPTLETVTGMAENKGGKHDPSRSHA